MKKVLFFVMSLFVVWHMSSQVVCKECFFTGIESESENEEIRFSVDYKLLGSYDDVSDDGTIIRSFIWEDAYDMYNAEDCPELEGMNFREFWFTVQNGKLIGQNNGWGHYITPVKKDDIETCLSMFVEDNNGSLVSIQVVNCVSSRWDGDRWKFDSVEYEDILINEEVYDTEYIDF